MKYLAEAIEFGEELIRTDDLDPVYSALYKAQLEPDQLRRWLLAYWYFYHMGAASVLSEILDPVDYWRVFREMITSAPRGTERRHFRGQAAQGTVDKMEGTDPVSVVDEMFAPTFAECKARAMKLPLNGPWIAFKIADMYERVLSRPVDFTGCNLEMYRDPVMGAALILHGDTKAPLAPGELDLVVFELLAHFELWLAPPNQNRLVNLQEIETILCKYKSHYNGHYPMGKDTKEIREALAMYAPFNETAERLLNETY